MNLFVVAVADRMDDTLDVRFIVRSWWLTWIIARVLFISHKHVYACSIQEWAEIYESKSRRVRELTGGVL